MATVTRPESGEAPTAGQVRPLYHLDGPTPPAPVRGPAGPPWTSHRWAGWVAYGVVFLAALELVCRVEDLIVYGTPVLSRYTSQADLLVLDSSRTGGGGKSVHGRPYARYQKWVLNGFGMRGPEVSAVAPPRTVRVVTAGASETFGLTESPHKEYPRQLEDSLNRNPNDACRASADYRFEILNAAMPGMSLPTIRRDLQLRVASLRPDVVMYYPSPAQYLVGDHGDQDGNVG